MITEKIQNLIDVFDDCEFDAHEIAVGLKVIYNRPSSEHFVSSMMGKMARRGDILRTKLGVYRSRTNTHENI